MKNFIFGDTGGHMKQLFASLREIGIDPRAGTIPEGIRVIHLGDLIHKGPHSSLLLETVDRLIRNNPGQWVQLLGNHEFQHIEGSPYFWRCKCSIEDIGIINDWFDEDLASATFALESFSNLKLEVSARPSFSIPNSGILFSHASLSWDWWNAYGRLNDPVDLSNQLNAASTWEITTPGEMLGVQGRLPGPVWAIGNSEVFNSWKAHEEDSMPFMQFHGHTTSYQWTTGRWWRTDKEFRAFRNSTKLNPSTRAVITSLSDNLLVGVDPGYALKADNDKQPFVSFES